MCVRRAERRRCLATIIFTPSARGVEPSSKHNFKMASSTETLDQLSTLGIENSALRAPSPKPSERRTSTRYVETVPVGGLTYIDFMPFKKEDRFSLLVDQANAWLKDHPDWEVRTCETVEFKVGSGAVNILQFEKMTFYEDDVTVWMRYARGLRLWVVQRMGEEPEGPQTIAYFNVIPRVEDTLCGKPRFQTMDELIDQLNQVMQDTPVEGRIITIETLRIKFSPFKQSIDPERTLYRDHGYNLDVLRIFYEKGDSNNEIIEVEDFKPNCLQHVAHPLHIPKYEDFTAVIRKVQDWCVRRRRDVRVCNTQTIWIKIKNGQVDSQRTFFTEHKDYNFRTQYVRIIRVAYAHAVRETNAYPEQRPIRICCRTFLPVQLSTRGFFSPPNFENMSQTRDRIAIWILQNNVRVISAETCSVRMYTGGERFDGPDATCTYNSGGQNEHWIYVFRLFLDGRYPGVPPEMDRGAFLAWNQEPLTITQQHYEDNNEFCSIQ